MGTEESFWQQLRIAAFASWLSRGWCQSEMWTHALSLRDVVPAIAVHSMNKAEFIGAAAFEYSPLAGFVSTCSGRSRRFNFDRGEVWRKLRVAQSHFGICQGPR